MSKLLFWLERKLGALFLRLLKASIRFEVVNEFPAGEPCIYMIWHRNLLPIGLQRAGVPIAVLISSSKDGELIAGPVSELGYIPVRGSSTRQGTEATRELLRISKTHQIGITPDGPKGPPKSISPGVLTIAYLAKIPIIPIQAELSREWVFNSWDKFRVPKPFCRAFIKYGDPVWITTKDGHDLIASQLRSTMDNMEMELKAKLNQQK